MAAVAAQFSAPQASRLEPLELHSSTLQVLLSMHEPKRRAMRSVALLLPNTISPYSKPIYTESIEFFL